MAFSRYSITFIIHYYAYIVINLSQPILRLIKPSKTLDIL